MDWCWIDCASDVFRKRKDECLKLLELYCVCGGGFFGVRK